MSANAMRVVSVIAFCMTVFLLPTGGAVRADDDGPTLVTRLYDLQALTDGRPDFMRERNFGQRRDRDYHPLFGAEIEEPLYPAGSIDEIIELIENFVDARTWEEVSGADMAGVDETYIIARAPAATLDAVGLYLAQLERETMGTVTVDVHSVRLSADQAASLRAATGTSIADDAARKLIAGTNAGPAATVTTYAGSRAAAYTGRQVSFVEDFDVEVAKGSTISDPIVNVANVGLALDLIAREVGETGWVRVAVNGAIAKLGEPRAGACGDGRSVDLPAADVEDVYANVSVRNGTWNLLDGTAGGGDELGWHLLVRATTRRQGFAAPSQHNWDYGKAGAQGAHTLRHLRISDLNHAPAPSMGWNMHLMPSNFTPPEPPELRDPRPIFPAHRTPEFLMTLAPDGVWDDPATMEARNGRLIVRNRPAVLDGVVATLDQLRRQMMWSIVCTTEVIELPLDMALGDDFVLNERSRATLEDAIRAGHAQRIDSVRVASLAGTRNTIRSGNRFNYVADFEVEIAERSAISNPVIQSCLEGMQVDIDPALCSGGKDAQLCVQITRTQRPGATRTSATPVGTIDLPELDVLRIRTNLVVPLGRSAVVGAGTHGGRRRVVLVTPQVERFGD